MREVFALLGICSAGAVLAAGACGPPAADVRGPVWVEAVASPVAKRESIDVVPAELGDDEAVDRMRHRVRMRRIGAAWLSLDGESINDDGGQASGPRLGSRPADAEGDEAGLDELLPAIGEAAGKIRVVVEEDHARLAVWIERRDAWPSIVARVKLERVASGSGPWLQTGTAVTPSAGSAGVWLEAGAPIAVRRGEAEAEAGGEGGARRGGGRRTGPAPVRIALRDPEVVVRGAVPPAFVGHVWIVPRGDQQPMDMTDDCAVRSWEPPEDPRPQRRLTEEAAILAAPSKDAAPLAVTHAVLEVAVIARHGAWTEVELVRPYARIRGFVEERALYPLTGKGGFGGGCTGRGFGMSHADRIEVPAGTCLYDRANGEIVGVAVEEQVRLGSKARGGEAWSMVYVNTRWALSSVYVRDTGSDPAQPRFESCAGRGHR